MWDLIVSVPDHCLSFYFTDPPLSMIRFRQVNCIRKVLRHSSCYHWKLDNVRTYPAE